MDSHSFNGYGWNFRNSNWLWNVSACLLCRSKTIHYRKNIAMGYAMLYALMNLGGFLPAIISPLVREKMGYGIIGVFWVYVALTVVGIGVIVTILTKKAIKDSTVSIISKSDDENGLKVFLDTLKQKFVEKKKEAIIGSAILAVMLAAAIIKELYFKEMQFSNQV